MNIENIDSLSRILNYFNTVNIGLFTDKVNPSLLIFCNLLDDNFFYYNLEEKIITELTKSDIKFNVLLINKSLSLKNIKLLFKYSKKYGVKLIYAPTDISDLDSQKNIIHKYDLVIIPSNFKNTSIALNDNVLIIPSNLDEEYEFIRESLLFDEEEYASKYQLIEDDTFDPILHYLTVGYYENCNPCKKVNFDDFLDSYPEIKEYDINAFTYYLILKQLFRIMNFYPFEDLIYNPSLFRLVLWDNNIINNINEYLKNEYEKIYFEISEESSKLIFKQTKKLSDFKYDSLINLVSKPNLMIKNRTTGKRILKEINDYEVELTGNDLLEIGINGIYDIFVQISSLNKDLLFRVNFDQQNNNIMLMDKTNNIIFWAYETLDNYLAFKYEISYFAVKSINLKNESNNLLINGEIILFDDLDFETVELLIPLNQEDTNRKVIICNYNKYENRILFTGLIDFKYYSTDIGPHFKINVRLKDKQGMIIANNVIPNYHYMIDLKKNLRKYVKKSVFFESFHSKFYSGQPKYIYEKMLEMGLNKTYDFVWAYKGNEEIPGSPMITARGSKNYKEILGASDYWITNISFPFLKPNKNTVYVQTTHGTPYKHMGSDIESDDENITRGRVLIESPTWNYLISPNDYAKEIFARSFEYEGTIINQGYPANDIFYENTTLKEQKLKKQLNINPNKKIILYCPTFRDYEKDNKNGIFSYVLDLEKLYHEISDEYIILLRLHYSISKHLVLPEEMKSSIIDLSDYNDVADLYLISDILITDYSSVFFDFAHSKKPILFYVPDFEKYSSFRGLYSEVKENLPGPELYTNDEVIESIKNIDKIKTQYKEKYNTFYEKFCGIGHGDASEKVINIVFGDVNNE